MLLLSIEGASVKYKYREAGTFTASLMILTGDEMETAAQAEITVSASQGVFDDYGQGILLIVGLLATVVVTVVVTRIARKALSESLGDEGAETADDSA